MSFLEVYEEFKIYAAKRHKKQGFDTITKNFTNNVLPFFANRNINDISVNDIIKWQNDIIDKNFSNNYNRSIYSSFNNFLNYCVLNSYISCNYLLLVGSFKKKYEIHNYQVYSYFEYLKFRKFVTDKIFRYFFDILYFYGLRSGEAMALKFSDLTNNYLNVFHSIERGGSRTINVPKTPKSNRKLKLSVFMVFKLFILRCLYVKKYGNSNYDYFIFGGLKPLAPTTINRIKKKASDYANVKNISLHEFRHSYATRNFNKFDIKVLSERLGHSSISITLDTYVHLQNKKKGIIPLFETYFFNTITKNFKKLFQSIITRFV